MAAPPLSSAEWRIIQKLREVRQTHLNFKLTIYGQGSATRRILDMEWSPRERLDSTEELPPAIDD